ncbi:MAG TPA: hypothetical protein VK762_11790 [Polyangiaceae bacterium]|nr:hypothetical protein [Polyangiaceae bacterium]
MQIDLPCGRTWNVREASKKLTYRAELPGARVFDLVAASLRRAKTAGVSVEDRFNLALPASWLVNSPAISTVLRRWALQPHREACLALIDALEQGPAAWSADPGTAEGIRLCVAALGDEAYVTEALSKVLALVVPEAVPLMPSRARAFVLGDEAKDHPDAFGGMVDWFARAALAHATELDRIAREHREVELSGAGVLDRLLWFDSEGHAHFPKID